MKSNVISRALLFLSASITIVIFISINKPVNAYYACGGGPCDNISQPCNAPYTCNPNPGGVCGVFYNSCSGTTCNANGGFDSSTCSTGNQCNPAGTTNTAGWTYGACTTNCGSNTRVATCTCNTLNNCAAATCSNPPNTYTCNQTYNDTSCACVSQDPQTAPASVGVSQNTDGGGVPIRTATISWTFQTLTDGCGNDWGYNCLSNSDEFVLHYDGVPALDETQPKASGAITHTSGLFAWGAHSVIVCARNGFGEKCAASVPFTLTAPTCSVSGQASDAPGNASCRSNNPTFSSAYGNNADQIGFFIKSTTSDLAYGNLYSTWINTASPVSYVPTPALTTGKYYWNTMSQSTTAPVACVTPATFPTGFEVNIDQTAPGVPVGSNSLSIDPSCLGKYFLTHSWTTVTDTGCAGLAAAPYQGQIATSNTYGVTITDDTGWITPAAQPQQKTAVSYPGGTTLYAQARARDSLGNTSIWSADSSTPITFPTPTLYPTIYIEGNYIEDTGNPTASCNGTMTIDPGQLTVNLNVSGIGVTPVCTPGATKYQCYITIDNQNTPCAVADHTVSLSGSYGSYTEEWRAGNGCGGTPIPTINITPPPIGNPPQPTLPIFFHYPPNQGWFKTSSTSFANKSVVVRSNIIPNNPVAFDSDDDTSRHLIKGEAGVVVKSGTLDIGPNAKIAGQTTFSTNNWYSSNYETNSIFTPSKFADYLKSRKKYITITDINQITEDGIFYTNGDLIISDATVFKDKKVVIVADKGTVTINTNITPVSVPPASSAVAILSNAVVINGAVTEIDAIVVGNIVDVGSSANSLKINGNLIQLTNTNPFVNNRVFANAKSPSVFIKFNQGMYLDLLSYLSISLYDWRQLQ